MKYCSQRDACEGRETQSMGRKPMQGFHTTIYLYDTSCIGCCIQRAENNRMKADRCDVRNFCCLHNLQVYIDSTININHEENYFCIQKNLWACRHAEKLVAMYLTCFSRQRWYACYFAASFDRVRLSDWQRGNPPTMKLLGFQSRLSRIFHQVVSQFFRTGLNCGILRPFFI